MRFLFISSKTKSKVNRLKIKKLSSKLPKSIAIAYSIQYQNIAREIKNLLSKNHEIICLIQILGCSKPKFPKNTQAVLLIGSGRFHATALAFETSLPIYILYKNNLEKISEEDVGKLEKAHKTSYLNFLNASKVGIIISLKPGQQKFKEAIKLRNKIKDKKSYLFLADNINNTELENYNIGSWINTACPRLDMDGSFINYKDLKKIG